MNILKMHKNLRSLKIHMKIECGRVQLMKNEKDDDPILIDTMMKIHTVKWNPIGSMFAISGT